MAVSVITPAQKTDLVTLDSVKTYLGVTGADQDATLSSLIVRASSEFDRYRGRPLALQTYHERQRLSAPMPGINLSRGPIAAIQSLTIDGKAWQELDEFDVDRARACIMSTAFLPMQRRLCQPAIVDVVYTAGYLLPGDNAPEAGGDLLSIQTFGLPANIAGACLGTILMLSMAGGRDPLLKSESVQGVGNTTWQALDVSYGALSPDAVSALDSLALAADWMA
ncbi:MAG: phage head-tail connector protein [Acetobacter orientalis]|uniref:phage head-tail connector protein n=1 Tax=Acetobacter orientalis TaxID=146474 RepID=UPI0039E864C6